MSPALRRLWLKLHRWVALALGGVLVLAGFLGALLVLAKPLDQWAHPELFRQAVQAKPETIASLTELKHRLDHEFGPGTGYTFRPPRKPDDTLWVFVRGPWQGVVYFDSSGRELGRRGEAEGAYNLLFELHSALLLGDTGKAVLTTAAGTYLFLLVTGLILWWPRRWPPSFRIHWRAGALRASVDLHNATGALLGVLIAVSVASGAYMAWPPLRTFVTMVTGSTAVQGPKLPASAAVAAATPLDWMVKEAQAVFPDGMVGYIHVAPDRHQPVRVRLKLPDDPHPNGLSSVWLHPGTGEVLNVARWSELDAGNRLVATVYPLHTGDLGGPPHELLVGLTGLALTTLGAAGLLLWWKRRNAKARVPVAAAR